jgi:hypothetical protein
MENLQMTKENDIKNLTNDVFFDNALTILYQTCDEFERMLDAEYNEETEHKEQELNALEDIRDKLMKIRQEIFYNFQEISCRDMHEEIKCVLYNEKHY